MVHLSACRTCDPLLATDIPPEIFYRIYDFLPDDLRTLSACTRVSKRWHDVARRCLFSNIIVRGQPQYSHLCALVACRPDIGGCISHLEIHPAPASTTSAGDTAPLNLAALAAIISKLTNLRRLTFWTIPALSWEDATPVVTRPSSPVVALQEVHFTYTDRHVARQLPLLYHLLCSFDSVDTVVFEALNPFAGHTPADRSALAQRVKVRRLVFEGCAAQAVHVDFFHRIVVPGALRSVTLSIPYYFALDAATRIRAFFKESAVNVVDLEIRWLRHIAIWPMDRTRPEGHLHATWKLLGETIRSCGKLERLRLRAPDTQTLTGGTNGFLATFAPFETIFSSVPRTVREVVVRLGTNLNRSDEVQVPGLQFWDLGALDTMFLREGNRDLCRVEVEVVVLRTGEGSFSELEAMVMSALPKLWRAALLRVVEVR